MTDQPVILNAYQLGLWYENREDLDLIDEPVYGDPDYDYGYADDGFPIPPPCPIDGVPMNACVHHPGYDY